MVQAERGVPNHGDILMEVMSPDPRRSTESIGGAFFMHKGDIIKGIHGKD